MSRVGKQPIQVPSGVQMNISEGKVLVQGPKGKLEYVLGTGVELAKTGSEITVVKKGFDKQSQANYGTTRASLNNMILGVTNGWKKALELSGVGYTAKLQGDILSLALGYSHEVKLVVPQGVKCSVNKNVIELESCDKEKLGTFAARIRKARPPEPYLGKGVKYVDEIIRRKAGKTGKK